MSFCNQLPELFRLALPEVKREIIQTCIRTLSYNGETLKIELFPIFYKLKYWKNVKNGPEYVSLLELFNKTLQPVLSSPQIILLYLEIENYINGVEN